MRQTFEVFFFCGWTLLCLKQFILMFFCFSDNSVLSTSYRTVQYGKYFSNNILWGKESVVWRCSVKKVFLDISQNSLENTLFFYKVAGPAYSFIKKSLWHRCFPKNFAKFLTTPFFTDYLRWLLLEKRVKYLPIMQEAPLFILSEKRIIYKK